MRLIGQSGYVVLHHDEVCSDIIELQNKFAQALVEIASQIVDIPTDEMTVAEQNILKILNLYHVVENRTPENL